MGCQAATRKDISDRYVVEHQNPGDHGGCGEDGRSRSVARNNSREAEAWNSPWDYLIPWFHDIKFIFWIKQHALRICCAGRIHSQCQCGPCVRLHKELRIRATYASGRLVGWGWSALGTSAAVRPRVQPESAGTVPVHRRARRLGNPIQDVEMAWQSIWQQQGLGTIDWTSLIINWQILELMIINYLYLNQFNWQIHWWFFFW